MKMNINSLKKPWLSAAIFVLAAASLSSCLKDKGPVQDFSKSPALVNFQYTGSGSQDMVTSILPGTDDSVGVEVALSASSGTLTTPVTVTMAVDPDSLATYNAANGTSYTMIDPSTYTFPPNSQVTIPAGKQLVPFVIHINESLLDFSTDPILILKMTTVTGATIASNMSVVVLPIKLRNPYEGNYTVTGYFVHPSGPRAINQTKSLATITAVTSLANVGDLGTTFQFDVDPVTNSLGNWVPVTANPASGFINGIDNATGDPNYPGPPYVYTTYNNTYVPATKEFWMHYGYNGANPAFSREIYEHWVPQ